MGATQGLTPALSAIAGRGANSYPTSFKVGVSAQMPPSVLCPESPIALLPRPGCYQLATQLFESITNAQSHVPSRVLWQNTGSAIFVGFIADSKITKLCYNRLLLP